MVYIYAVHYDKIYHFGATVCKTVRPLSVLSVTLVICGQTVGWIKMKLGTRVGLGRVGPGHIVLHGDLTLLPPKGHNQPPTYGPYLWWPNGWMDQDGTWYGSRPRPKRHYVRWRPSSSLPKAGGTAPQFSAHVYCGQTAWIKMPVGMEVGLGPGHIVLDADPVAHVCCGQTAGWIKTPLDTK